MKRRALVVVGAAVLAAALLIGCRSTNSSATPRGASNPNGGAGQGGRRSGGGGGQATTPDPSKLVTVAEAATALGDNAAQLTKDTHQNEADGVITLVCDYNDDSSGAVEISVAPGSYDQNEVSTVRAVYSKSSLVNIGDGGVAFGFGSGNRAVEFWARGFRAQTGVTSSSGTAPDAGTSATSGQRGSGPLALARSERRRRSSTRGPAASSRSSRVAVDHRHGRFMSIVDSEPGWP